MARGFAVLARRASKRPAQNASAAVDHQVLPLGDEACLRQAEIGTCRADSAGSPVRLAGMLGDASALRGFTPLVETADEWTAKSPWRALELEAWRQPQGKTGQRIASKILNKGEQ
jgi:hypothetical protein